MTEKENFLLDPSQEPSFEDVLDLIGLLPAAGETDEDREPCVLYFLPEDSDILREGEDKKKVTVRGAALMFVLVCRRLGLKVSAEFAEPGREVIVITA